MTQFHEGQEVEVLDAIMPNAPISAPCEWRKAKIVSRMLLKLTAADEYGVEFPDDTRGVSTPPKRRRWARTYIL